MQATPQFQVGCGRNPQQCTPRKLAVVNQAQQSSILNPKLSQKTSTTQIENPKIKTPNQTKTSKSRKRKQSNPKFKYEKLSHAKVVYEKFCNLQLNYELIDFGEVVDAKLSNISKNITDQENNVNVDVVKQFRLPEGMRVILIEKISHVDSAVEKIRKNAKDNLISVDYEWTPDGQFFRQGKSHKISLIQIATSKLCVLFRVCNWNFEMPDSIRNLLCDPKFVKLVQCPYSADEEKLQQTFKMGFKDYKNYIDFSQLLKSLGYEKTSVRNCSIILWGTGPSKKGNLCDWEQSQLSLKHLHYAALDVFIIGTAIRQLQYQLKQGVKCSECQRVFGSEINIEKKDGICCQICQRWKFVHSETMSK